MLFVKQVAVALFVLATSSTAASAASDNACGKLHDLFINSFACCGSGSGAKRCQGIKNAFESSGCGSLGCGESSCTDGLDNDGNALADCADPTCSGLDLCVCTPPPPALNSWWDGDSLFDDTAFDIQGESEAVMTGVTTAPGVVGNAFDFDALGDKIKVTSPASLQLKTFTVTLWFKARSVPNAFPALVGKEFLPFPNRNYSMFIWRDGGNSLNGSSSFDGVKQDIISQVNVADGQYHFAAYSVDDLSKIQKIHVDGNLYEEWTFQGSADGQGSDFYIGNNVFGNNFDGLIDEVQVFARALLDDEVRAIYNALGKGVCK